MILRLAALAAGLFVATAASGQSYSVYEFSQPAGCRSRVPISEITQVPKGQLIWTGGCRNGFAEGQGEMLTYKNGQLVARSIGRRQDGYEEGPSVIVNTDPDSSEYGFQTYMTLQRGFPIGKITLLGRDGVVYGEAVGDGRGGFEQTSNPMSPLMEIFGRMIQGDRQINGAKLFIQMFAPQFGASISGCVSMMKFLRYTDQATRYWCNALPSNGS